MVEYHLLSDSQLLNLLRERNQAAFTELYDRYFQVLFVHAYKRLRDEEQSKDVIQEFFTTLWIKGESITLKGAFIAYCFTAVNNRIIDLFLHEKVSAKYISAISIPGAAEESRTDHLIREKQLMAFIELEIQALPPKMREVFELSRKSHYTYKEIAQELSISEKTVHRQIVNALNRLKSKLGSAAFLFLLIGYK